MHGLTIRAALLLGFGLTLTLWAFTGYRFTRQVAAGEVRAAAISNRYQDAQAHVSAIRDDVLFISITLREALLESNETAVRAQRSKLEAAWQRVDTATQQYVPVMDSPLERQGIARLRRELAGFHVTMKDILAGLEGDWTAAEQRAFRDRIAPHRASITRVSDEVQAMNRRIFIEQQSGVAMVYRSIQRPLWQLLGIALLLTLAIALWSTRHASRLERHVSAQAAHEARTAEELQRLSAQLLSAQEEERRTIARELHDEVGQVLTAIKMELTLAEHALRAGHEPAPFERVRRITEGALQSVRDLSHVLHPAMLDDFGLPAAIEHHLRGLTRRSGLAVSFDHRGLDSRLAPEVEVTIYRIVQEGLTNVIKHARAQRCRVSVEHGEGRVALVLEDDGVGFDPSARAGEPGLGLISIRERVSRLGGRLDVRTGPGQGTRLRVELPTRDRGAVEEPSPAEEPSPTAVAHLNPEAVGG